jgi:poly(3-hydroxyoctanoate) depolymerase
VRRGATAAFVSRPLIAALVVVFSGCDFTIPTFFAPPDAGSPATDAGADDAGTSADAGSVIDAGQPDRDAGAPRCTFSSGSVNCPPVITPVMSRDVYWQSPSSPPPAAGFPAIIIYQGSFFSPAVTWNEVPSTTLFGGFEQARLQAMLLEAGFTVIAPSALAGVAWQTNSGLPWDATSDKPFIDALLDGVRDGTFGPVDVSRLYAAGISSGGYMTSRMAVSYPGVFRALVIHSGSYATCVGVVCVLPASLPAQHPPTRFLHGRADLTVPLFTAESYQQRLTSEGFEADLVIDDAAGHEWLSVSPERTLEWVQTH